MSASSKAALPETGGIKGRLFFTEREWRTVEAMSARTIPTTETPGSREAGGVCFIDRMLAGHYSNHQSSYREGLQRLDTISEARFARQFADLNESEQDQLLSLLEAGSISGWSEAAAFFELVRMHTIEGLLSDPKYGGNRNAVGWAALL